jgi:hypothetical protein
MTEKMMILVAAAIFGLAAGAQANAKPAATGTVIVYRQWSFTGSAISKFPFNINHGPDLGVRNGRYLRFELPPGDYTFSHDHTPVLWFMRQDPQAVHVEAGKTVYFQYVGVYAIIFEIADDQAQAARTVTKMKEGN